MIVIIYSLVCKTNPELVYIGSTQEYNRRKAHHKFSWQENPKKVYEIIRSNGGWDNFVMTPIKPFECNTRQQACEEEDKYIVEMKATMNTIRAVMSEERVKKYVKGYKEENKDKINEANKKYYQEHKEERKAYRESIAEEQKEYKKKWYEEHREERLKKNKEEYTCACGKVGTLTNKTRHEKSKFHLDFIQRQ